MKEIIEKYFDRLFPINRSLTGYGNRETLKILSELVDLNIYEVPSGTSCFDWTVPPEWNISEAWIKNSKGEIIVDFAKLNLHLLGYSESIHKKMGLSELKKHLHSLPDMPEAVPYLTSYYNRRWGFCLSYNQLLSLQDDEYEVYIDSTLDEKGSMSYGEAILQGREQKEILFSTYICHPSMANNELSGPLVTAFLYEELKKRNNLRYTYRFIFIPETIGSIYYLSKHGKHLKDNLLAGFVVTCIGDSGIFTYKRSRKKDSLPNKCVELLLEQTEEKHIIHDFFPSGSDERQYCSPGFNLPVGSLMRTMYGKYLEYHTSADNKDFVSFKAMEESVKKYLSIVDIIENNHVYYNTNPFCEPQLGKRGLYPTLGSQKSIVGFLNAIQWLLNLADGTKDLITISKISNQPYFLLVDAAKTLVNKNLLEVI